jgi:hypothetical protein
LPFKKLDGYVRTITEEASYIINNLATYGKYGPSPIVSEGLTALIPADKK